jgi:hypothetical protein
MVAVSFTNVRTVRSIALRQKIPNWLQVLQVVLNSCGV